MSKYANLFSPEQNPLAKEPLDRSGQEQPSQSKTFKLLFVDDEENVLNALKRLFREENYHVLTVSSGEEALKIMEDDTIHLVISDYKMPGMVGTELLKEIKARWPETIRIMLTGQADIQAIMGAVNEGAVYKFITKPWGSEDLRLTVSLALQQYVLIHENRKLKKVTKEQEIKIKDYSALFDEYRGVLIRILAEAGIITKEQQERVAKEILPGEFIGDVIVRLGFTTESRIVEALREYQDIAYLDLKEVYVNPTIAKLLPKEICEKSRLLPVKLEGKQLTLAMADPSDLIKTDNIAMLTGLKVIPVVAKSSTILGQIKRIYGEEGGLELSDDVKDAAEIDPLEEIDIVIDEEELEVNVEQLLSSSGIPPVIRIVNSIILEALRYRASDIHIEPKTQWTIVRYRIDGLLQTKVKIPPHIHAPVISRIKILSKIDIAERRKPQDGRITIKAGTKIVDVRVATMPTITGEKVVMRILDKGAAHKQLSQLGLQEHDLQKLEIMMRKPQGIVIATGPTGSGKTTLLYSILHKMLTPTKNIETIEDPVEYFLEEANQVYVKERIGLSFASVLRATLRQDPDIILVGEIRDYDTADVAFKSALTGHMVLTSLHTNNTIVSITRLIDIGVKPYIIASAIEGIIAQRLVRKICQHCKISTSPDKDILSLLKLSQEMFKKVTLGKGCDRCNHTGYTGRAGIFEVLLMNDEFRQLITTHYKESEILNAARLGGMKTLIEDGIDKVNQGVTSLEELVRVIGPPTKYQRPCLQCGRLMDIKYPFCAYCGIVAQNICYECKLPLEEEWKVCPHCGTFKKRPEGG